jgi:hypothetical protein
VSWRDVHSLLARRRAYLVYSSLSSSLCLYLKSLQDLSCWTWGPRDTALTCLVDPTLPSLPARLNLARQLLEHSLHLEALDTITTAREEDELNVEAAYLEGWAWFLRAEAVLENPSFQVAVPPKTESRPARGEVEMEGDENQAEEDEDSGPENMSPDECFAESMRALVETAKLYSEQEYPDEGIGAHTAELLEGLEKRGVKPAILDEAEGETEGEDGGWEDVEDVEMA